MAQSPIQPKKQGSIKSIGGGSWRLENEGSGTKVKKKGVLVGNIGGVFI